MATTNDSTIAPQSPPTSPTPSVASSSADSSKGEDKKVFKSNLQVLLKRQDDELSKNREYKKKIEESEEKLDKEDEEDLKSRESKKGTEKGGASENDIFSGDNSLGAKSPKAGNDTKRKQSTGGDSCGKKNYTVKKTAEKSKETNNREAKDDTSEEEEEEASPIVNKATSGEDKHKLKNKESTETSSQIQNRKEEQPSPKGKGKAGSKDSQKKDAATEGKKEQTNVEVKTKQTNKPLGGGDRGGGGGGGRKNDVTDNSKTGKADNKQAKKGKKSKTQPDTPPSSSGASPPLSASSASSDDGKGKRVKDKEAMTVTKPENKKQQGVLYKKGSNPFSSWNKYFFVLDGKLLMYYRSADDYKSLVGAKGSLDLTMVENIQTKKAGRMRSHYPFILIRRNLKPFNLATETEEERTKWMQILEGAQKHPNRRSGSENILNSCNSPGPEKEREDKYATMPNITPAMVPDDGADSRSEDSSSESEKESKEVEEPVIIQPKKVQRIGPGILLNLDDVKLKKVKNEKRQEVVDVTKNEEDADKEKLFGVHLRKVTQPSAAANTSDKADKAEAIPKEATLHDAASVNRANIPLNKSPLLAHADIQSNNISRENKLSNKSDKNRSPSPSIPLSKGVHTVLVKSNDKSDSLDAGVLPELEKVNDKPVCIAESSEIRYSDDVLNMENALSVEYVHVEDRTAHSEDNDHKKDNESSDLSVNEKQSDTLEILQVSITVKENVDVEQEYEELDEELLQSVQQNKSLGLKNSDSSETTKAREHNESETRELPVGSEKSDNIAVVTDKSASTENQNDCMEFDEEFLKNIEELQKFSESLSNESSTTVLTVPSGKTLAPESGTTTPPNSPLRMRSCTNESSNSSCKSDSEGSDKKIGKFKILASPHSDSSDEGKQDLKEGKEKRRKKNSFSRFIPGRKSKDKKKKSDDDNPKPSQTNDCPKSSDKLDSTINDQTKIDQDINSDTTNAKIVIDEEQNTSTKDIPSISVQMETGYEKSQQVELRHDSLTIRGESRCSTYSRSSTSSRDKEPPPLVPEKRGGRAKSPAYDIPQSNLPVSSADYAVEQIEVEPEEDKKVDGIISQEQIHAILSARDSREKKRKLSIRNSAGLMIATDTSGNEIIDEIDSRRPSFMSVNSTESDEPLPKTNFLTGDRRSSSSGSLKLRRKSDDSDASSDTQSISNKTSEMPAEQEQTVVMRRPSRLAESIAGGPRISLTSPEFTVMEEEGPVTPDVDKTTFATETEDDLVNSSSEPEPDKSSDLEEAEHNDYFPIIGGKVELRQPSPARLLPDSSGAGIRTSGISGLKAFLEENQTESISLNSGVNRLGHSAAIEKLKEESS